MEKIIFYFFALLTLGSAFMVVAIRNVVRSIFLFFVTMFALAGLFVFSLADFVAVTQIVVYVGGVLVLMLFAFMLSNREVLNEFQENSKGIRVRHVLGFIIAAGLLGVMIYSAISSNIDQLEWIKGSKHFGPSDNMINHIGVNIMTRYLLPFELTSVLLMMALVGAAHLARKEKKS